MITVAALRQTILHGRMFCQDMAPRLASAQPGPGKIVMQWCDIFEYIELYSWRRHRWRGRLSPAALRQLSRSVFLAEAHVIPNWMHCARAVLACSCHERLVGQTKLGMGTS